MNFLKNLFAKRMPSPAMKQFVEKTNADNKVVVGFSAHHQTPARPPAATSRLGGGG
jgi:hypothetical protein